LRFRPGADGFFGPVHLTWVAAAGASGYEVDLFAAAGHVRRATLNASRPELRLPPLPTGLYFWAVRSVSATGARSESSPERGFEIADSTLKLNVKTNSWK